MSKLNKNSSGYIFGFALLVILFCGILLSVVSGALAEKQEQERELERQKFILKAALGDQIDTMQKQNISVLYGELVEEMVIDTLGKQVSDMMANQVQLKKEYKKLNKQGDLQGINMNLPLYLVKDKETGKVGFYVMPMYGFGLWDNIWGYAALKADLNTLRGVVLDHKGETPGLGARITEAKVQNRYADKQIYDASGSLVSVNMQKGEGNDYSSMPHQVDGLSGATLTADGVNNMMTSYLELYRPYLESLKKN